MSRPPLEILVVGAGSIGRRHMANLQRLGEGIPCRISVVEPAEDLLRRICGDLGLAGFSSLEEALSRGRPDAAIVSSPTHMHVPQARALLESGCDLFVEKPLAMSRADAEVLRPLLQASGRYLMVGCNLRFHPGVRTLSVALAEGRIGRPLLARATFAHYLPNWRPGVDYRSTYSARRSAGGGILLDAIHEPDYLCWLFGTVDWVMGSLARVGDLDMDVEDTAEYTMRHGTALSQVHVDCLRRDKLRGCEIVGTEGTLLWQSRGKNPEEVSVRLFDAGRGEWEILLEQPSYDLNLQYVDEMLHFLRCITGRTAPMNGLSEALSVLGVMDAVRFSSDSGKRVLIPQEG